MSDSFVASFASTLKLSQSQSLTIALGMALAQSQVIRASGTKYLHQVVTALTSSGSFGVEGLPDAVAHDLITFISTKLSRVIIVSS